ncbi:MAG TPA: acyltransferase family protein [Chitinophagaceae bacterium]|nr:acyltransferase family protein [Chitinophagaceae bacterium]
MRLAYLDWLRLLSIAGVLVFHAAMPYVAEWDWHIKNAETSPLLLEFNFWLSRFRMPLLFFISGAITHVMLQRKSVKAFIGLRFRRLLLPLAAGMLLFVVPLQVYMERLQQGYRGSFFQFYPGIFTSGPYPEGNFSWHHLWFIAYLLVYDLLLAPLFKWCTADANRLPGLQRLARGQRFYWLMVPSVLWYTATSRFFPRTDDLIHDYCYFVYWLLFLLAGFCCMQAPALLQSLERNRRASFTGAVLTFALITYLRWNGLEPGELAGFGPDHPVTYGFVALFPVTSWLWVFTALGYGRRYLNRPHPALAYLNNAAYPFYILHQTVIVVLAYYFVRTPETIGMKYVFTVLATAAVSLALYHLCIRPYALMRLLFGTRAAEPRKTRPMASALSPQEAPGTVLYPSKTLS